MLPLKVIISGGGTGGHIFPAIAIANALKKKAEGAEILFVGAKGRMEMEKVPAAGYKIEGLNISGFQRRLTLKNLSFPFKLLGSLLKAKQILKKFKPEVVVGVGGYASGPMVHVAASNGVPTLIQEQNSYAGITNKLLGKKADKICVAYEGMERFFPKEKIILTGNPVRQDIAKLEGKRERGLEHFNLSPNKKTLLVIGGSLGARIINESIHKSLQLLSENNIQLIWQTGKMYFEQAEQVFKSNPFFLEQGGVFAFISKMDYAYAVADLVVSRAGAISVSELCLANKATILVPSPNVSEDHQTKNAMALVNHNAAVLLKDSEATEQLGKKVIELMNNDGEREKLERNIAGLAYSGAAELIANEVLKLIKH
ncbi:MAG: undecaprenyldiphospho-muramoylpentapeptide beta-N-acetylglucosaminyltransferase [Flavobacteriales bacterium]|nr:undecaprenyldiphospho-muramoylpentapeptide beta-N-acetylglucosaminyltransferase [Bacteroidales bacterium AH-315-I05]PCJ89027.1 MAG: undecaprenyldiphospho-muramoylpentapeptide beta-N-acetylglucosaminyltransferase [Flavobacteriales bacterium]